MSLNCILIFLDIALNCICHFLLIMNTLFRKTLIVTKIGRYILLNKQVNRSKHFFYNNKLFLKLGYIVHTGYIATNLLSLSTQRTYLYKTHMSDQRQTVKVKFRDRKPLGRGISGRTG